MREERNIVRPKNKQQISTTSKRFHYLPIVIWSKDDTLWEYIESKLVVRSDGALSEGVGQREDVGRMKGASDGEIE